MASVDTTQADFDEPTEPPPAPQWQNLKGVFGCLVAALVDAAPVFAESFFNCLNGSGPPEDDGYRPGERKRCP